MATQIGITNGSEFTDHSARPITCVVGQPITKTSIHNYTVLGIHVIWLSWIKVDKVCNLPSFMPHPVFIGTLV